MGSLIINAVGDEEAFRWTQAAGMQSVADWLADAGVTVVGWTLTGAEDVSDDGTIVVGEGTNPDGDTEAYLARANSGLISLNTISTITGSATSQTSTILHGAHGHPNSNRSITGKSCFWVAGDWSENRHDNDASAGLAEIGGCYNPHPTSNWVSALARPGAMKILPLVVISILTVLT